MLKSTGCTVPHSDVNLTLIKVWMFFWIFRQVNTRMRDFLHRHGTLGSPICPFCTVVEDATHLFFACPRIASFWQEVCPHIACVWQEVCPGALFASFVGALDVICSRLELLNTASLLLL